MIERRGDRRRGLSLRFMPPQADRRRAAYERRVGGEPVVPGMIRLGVGEAAPLVERRRYLDGGME